MPRFRIDNGKRYSLSIMRNYARVADIMSTGLGPRNARRHPQPFHALVAIMSADLRTILMLERIGTDSFRGGNLELGFAHIYGGQVLAQTLIAARETVPSDRGVHSIHAYFLRRGNHADAIDFSVERTRDGNSFATRRVIASQGGIPIYTMYASFQTPEDGLDYVGEAADSETLTAPTPEQGRSGNRFPSSVPVGIWAALSSVFEVHAVSEEAGTPSAHSRRTWFRLAPHARGNRDLDQPYLAYLSDYGLLTSALLPHGLAENHETMQIASIDHALWFHRPFVLDDWILFDCSPVSNSNGRGLTRGSFHDRRGNLIATVMQEGLVRLLSGKS